MGVMGVSLITPIIPQLRTVFVVSDVQVGLMITVYTLPGIFLTPFVGLIADRIGRRRTIIPLLFTFGIGGVGIAFVNSFTEVLFLRFLQGIGASALITLAVTLIGDFYEGPRQNAVMGINSSMIGTGAALYPVIGGTLATIHWNMPFLLYGFGILIGVIAVFILPEPEAKQSSSVRKYIASLRDIVFNPRPVGIFIAIFTVFFTFYGAIQTALPFLLTDQFALTSREIGLTLAMVSIASATVSSQFGRISKLRTRSELIALGFIAYGISLLGVWFARSPWFVGIALLAFGFGFGIVMPSIDTTIVTLASNQLRAGMMGIRTSMLRLGQTVGPVSFTIAAETVYASTVEGYRHLIVTFGTLILFTGLVSYFLLRR